MEETITVKKVNFLPVKQGLCLLTLVEAGVGDDGAAQRAGGVGGPVLGERAEAGLAEDVAAGVTAVRTEVDVQTHGAGHGLPVRRLTI